MFHSKQAVAGGTVEFAELVGVGRTFPPIAKATTMKTPKVTQGPARRRKGGPGAKGEERGARNVFGVMCGAPSRCRFWLLFQFVTIAKKFAKNEMTPHHPFMSVSFCISRYRAKPQELQATPPKFGHGAKLSAHSTL